MQPDPQPRVEVFQPITLHRLSFRWERKATHSKGSHNPPAYNLQRLIVRKQAASGKLRDPRCAKCWSDGDRYRRKYHAATNSRYRQQLGLRILVLVSRANP